MLRVEAIRNGCVYLIGDEKLVRNKRCPTKEDNEGILFITNTNIEGIFRYGYEQKKMTTWVTDQDIFGILELA